MGGVRRHFTSNFKASNLFSPFLIPFSTHYVFNKHYSIRSLPPCYFPATSYAVFIFLTVLNVNATLLSMCHMLSKWRNGADMWLTAGDLMNRSFSRLWSMNWTCSCNEAANKSANQHAGPWWRRLAAYSCSGLHHLTCSPLAFGTTLLSSMSHLLPSSILSTSSFACWKR